MTLESTLVTLGPLVAVLAPMVGAPLSLITFYLRALRENVAQTQCSLARRVESLEAMTLEFRRNLGDIPRDYTTKEEWLRELLHTRRVLEQVTEATIRLQATLDALFAHPTNPTPRSNETNPNALHNQANQSLDRKGAAQFSKLHDESNTTDQPPEASPLPQSQNAPAQAGDYPRRSENDRNEKENHAPMINTRIDRRNQSEQGAP